MADSPPADRAGTADAVGAVRAADGSGAADVSESITVGVPPSDAYRAVCDVRRMARWSPECFAVLVWSRKDGLPARFVGLNRRGPCVWFTTCRGFTGKVANNRAAVNRTGMRTTLARLKRELEEGEAHSPRG